MVFFAGIDPFVQVGIVTAIFLVLVFQAVPIGVSFAIAGFVGLVGVRGFDVALRQLGEIPYVWASSQMLIPMPLFILMGFLVFYAGVSRDLFAAAFKWLGKLPGGLAVATTVANAAFGACCGSAQAAAATMSPIAFPEMDQRGYSRRLATGSLSAGATLSFLIPPSIPFILYAVLAETSVSKLFIAGIIPGLLLCGLFVAIIFVTCRRNPDLGPAGPSFTWKERLVSLRGVLPIVVLFILVIGSLYLGLATPSEAGAIGAFGAFVIGIAMRKLKLPGMISAGKDTARIVCFVMTIIIGSWVFNTYLMVSGFTTVFEEWMLGLTVSPYVILTFLIVIYILIGMFLDIAAILVLTIPTIAPIMAALGFDLTWLGVVLIVLQCIGFISPPIGLNAFIVQGATNVPVGEVFRGSLPFIVAALVGLALMVAFPQIVLFLPGMM
ncbi:MAG: TRAP transporter large permease [Dehalococcoidia bacterium]|jgi:C4-dicarboxylate transporter, DctM subunit